VFKIVCFTFYECCQVAEMMMDKIIGSDGAKITHFINLDEGEVMEVDDKETEEKDEVTEGFSGRFQQQSPPVVKDATKKENKDEKEAEQTQPTKPMSDDKEEL
jgi:hypothetical protein